MKAAGAVRLRDRPVTRLAAIAVVLGAAVAGLLAAFLVSRPRAEPVLLQQPVTIKRALSTTAALFGDPVEAEVDVYSDDRTVAPGSVRVRTDFRPYRAATTRVDRTGQGHVSLLRSRIVLTCLTPACVPPRAGGRLVRFRPVVVTYGTGGRTTVMEAGWSPLQLSSRLPADATTATGVIDTAPPLDPGFALPPAPLRTVLLLVAAMLALVGGTLLVTGLWPPAFSALRRRRRLSPLERSLHHVETAAQSGDGTERRQVLDELATSLSELPAPSLETLTRSLAWGEITPEPETLTLVARYVRTSLNGGSRR